MTVSLKHLLKILNFVFVFLDNHAVHHVAEVQETIYGARALVRYLPPYSADFNPIEEVITRQKTSFRKMTLPSVAVFSPMRLSCMLLRKFHQKTAKGISETLAMSDNWTEVIILNPFVTHISVSCAESYSAELQNYLLLL